MTARSLDRHRTAVSLAVVLAVAGGIAVATGEVPLTRNGAFDVLAPRDGAKVPTAFEVRWSKVDAFTTYAVVVDDDVPTPGDVVEPGERILTITGQQVELSLGRATTGSPSARSFHTVTVIPLDAAGRRAGWDAAVVHVRNAA